MKLLGGILLIIGTSIGGGLLALPVSTSQIGFLNSSLLLFGCWVVMTLGAFLILEVNLWMPSNSNMISMAKATLGKWGQLVAWITYILLLYSLLAAYIAGGSDFLGNLLNKYSLGLPGWSVSLLFTLILGTVVFHGIKSIDIVNRFLMFLKMGSYFLLIFLMVKHVTLEKLSGGSIRYMTTGITVAITSFGYATIIPSLRCYFHNDIKKLRLAILIGSFIPLVTYILWDLTVMGIIPRLGDNGLIEMLHSGHSNSEVINVLSTLLQKDVITSFAEIFTGVCLLTSFLGVALCLSDFLSDGLKIEKTGLGNWFIQSLTLIPSLIVVLFYPGAFISALSYAGIYCVILLVLLPVLMVWYGRYRKNISNGYRVFGGKPLLVILMIISVLLIIQGISGSF